MGIYRFFDNWIFSGLVWRAGIGLIGVVAISMQATAGSIPEAQAAMTEYRQELKAASDAQAQSDVQGVTDHASKAGECLKRALKAYEAAGAACSGDPEILKDYGAALMANGDADLAADVLGKAVKKSPEDAGAWSAWGQALAAWGHEGRAEAVKALRTAVALRHAITLEDASHAAADYACLGRIYRQEGLYDFARASYEKALEIEPGNVGAKLALAFLKIRDGKILDASKDLDGLGGLPLEYAAQMPMLVGEAIHGFESTAGVFDDTAENHMAFAKLLLRAGRNDEALSAAERSAELKADDYTTWNFIGDVSRQLDKKYRAKAAYGKSLELKPDQPMTKEALEKMKDKG